MQQADGGAMETLRWLNRALRDLMTRLDTIEAMTLNCAAMTDEHTIEGWRARYYLEMARRMREGLAEQQGPEDVP